MADEGRIRKYLPQVDWEMIPAKLTFFLTDGYFGSILPFINVFYVSLGLSATHAGIISGTSLAISSMFNPLWSTLADATGYRKLIFIILCVGTGTTVFSMPWIEQAVAKTVVNITCSGNLTINETDLTNCHLSRHLLNPHTLFYTLLPLNVVAWIFFTSLRCYVDGTVTNVANTRSTKKNYGRQRAIACIGYAFFNLITGIITDHYHPKNMSPYTAVFYVFLPCVVCLVPIGCVLVGQAKWDDKDKSEATTNISQQLLMLFKRLNFVVFFTSVVVYGLVLNVYNCFFFMLMEHEFNSSKTLMSFALSIGILFEILMFVVSARAIRLFRGNIISLIIGLFSFFPRFIIMSYVGNPWYMLITQPLHALGMALAWTAIVDHTYTLVPQDIKVSAIAIVSSVVFVATAAAVNMIGGVFYDVYGGRLLFRYTGIVAAVWSLIMSMYFGMQHKSESLITKKENTYAEGIPHEIDIEDTSAV